MQMKGAVLGHSMVAGLFDHLSYRRQHAHLSARQVAREMSCSTKVLELHLIGERGASAIGYSVPLVLNDIRPNFCVLHLGSNDLARGAPALEVAMAVVNLAEQLLERDHVDHVAICSVLPRTRSFRNGMDSDRFTRALKLCNTILYDCCDTNAGLTYWSHDGFWNKSVGVWSRDGIHPNTHTGRKLYKNSMRWITLKTAGQVYKLHNIEPK